MKIFRSKIGPEIFLPVAILFIFLFYQAIVLATIVGFFFTVLVMIFLVYLVGTIEYIISDKTLEIKCGGFWDTVINVDEIKSIKEVTDIFGAPAASIKRIEIKYKEIGRIAISPKNKTVFINCLKQINPRIEIVDAANKVIK
jgi:hypothetical protein